MNHRRRVGLAVGVLAGLLVGCGAWWARGQEAGKPDVFYVPTPPEAVVKMLELAEIKPGDVLYDLGCGDGRIVVEAAKRYGIKAVGLDIDPARVREATENVRRAGVGHLVTIRQEDIFRADLSAASVVTLYLLPNLNVRLMPQLARLKPGSRIVSHSFGMKGPSPARSSECHRARESEPCWSGSSRGSQSGSRNLVPSTICGKLGLGF